MNDKQNQDVMVSVESNYIEGQSDPNNQQYVFSYTVTINNNSDEACQLISRHWLIQDANQKIEEVYGEGVVGKQPVIGPGEGFQYTSGAVIETDFGTMEGRYFMIRRQSDITVEFEIPIPKFILTVPRTIH